MTELYTTYAEWWPLLSAPEDYEEDAAAYTEILGRACAQPPRTLLELGSGGGNNASFMKEQCALTLVDCSPAMLDVSRALNPECVHREGDMRTVRYNEVFDAVFIHDAISYMRSAADLSAALETAYVHCREGGAALFVPDYTRETFRSCTYHGGYDGRDRSMRYLQWDRDPDPDDETYDVEFAYLFSDVAGMVSSVHETHTCGLFSRAHWQDAIRDAGFEPASATLESEQLEAGYYRVFIGSK